MQTWYAPHMTYGAYGLMGASFGSPGYSLAVPGLANARTMAIQEGPPTDAQLYNIPEWQHWSDAKRVRWLRDYVNEYARSDPRLRWFAVQILQESGVAPHDYPAQAAALLKWVQDNIYYTNEKGEQVQSPWRTIQTGTGDCDDTSVLLATLATAIGLPNRFTLYAPVSGGRKLTRWVEGQGSPSRFRKWNHISLQLGWPPSRPNHWAGAETILRGVPLGYDAATHGLSLDSHGRPLLPPGAASAAVRAPGAPSYGGFYGASTYSLGEEARGFWDTLWTNEFWTQVALAAVEGVAIALATAVVMGWYDKKRR